MRMTVNDAEATIHCEYRMVDAVCGMIDRAPMDMEIFQLRRSGKNWNDMSLRPPEDHDPCEIDLPCRNNAQREFLNSITQGAYAPTGY